MDDTSDMIYKAEHLASNFVKHVKCVQAEHVKVYKCSLLTCLHVVQRLILCA